MISAGIFVWKTLCGYVWRAEGGNRFVAPTTLKKVQLSKQAETFAKLLLHHHKATKLRH